MPKERRKSIVYFVRGKKELLSMDKDIPLFQASPFFLRKKSTITQMIYFLRSASMAFTSEASSLLGYSSSHFESTLLASSFLPR